MRIGIGLDTNGTVDDVVARARELAGTGAASLWVSQIFGWDALTLLSVVGRQVEGVDLGTAVVPVQPRHPVTLAAQALTAQSALGGRLVLGVGLSHQVVIESVFGLPWERPAQHMREYLSVLMPLLAGEQVSFQGEMVRASTFGPLEADGAAPPPVLVAALGPAMLRIAGKLADGTVTWMTGRDTLASHIVPSITAAANEAGRPDPRVVAHLPVCVTGDPDGARERAAEVFAIYGQLPSYRAMLDREGVAGPPDLAIVGSEEEVAAAVSGFAAVGVTEFGAIVYGDRGEQERTRALVAELVRERP